MKRAPLIYCAGAFSGNEDGSTAHHVHKAQSYGALVRAVGFVPLVPHIAILPPERLMPPASAWKLAMRDCIEMLRRCDGIFLIPGWENSRGARIERWLATRIFRLPEFDTLADLQRARRTLRWRGLEAA